MFPNDHKAYCYFVRHQPPNIGASFSLFLSFFQLIFVRFEGFLDQFYRATCGSTR
jgi:hypothetical protein